MVFYWDGVEQVADLRLAVSQGRCENTPDRLLGRRAICRIGAELADQAAESSDEIDAKFGFGRGCERGHELLLCR
jgi:hypothetical protein